jgi:hypothetical protein
VIQGRSRWQILAHLQLEEKGSHRMGDLGLAEVDLKELMRLGELLDERPGELGGGSVGGFLAEALLKVRSRSGAMVPLLANKVQEEYERRRGQRNVVLKARQMGMSTWIAGRLFLKTITIPGTLSVQVAHTQEAAEAIFKTVHRFHECLPASLRQGALRTGRANSRQICFPALDSEFRVESAGDGNAGRGVTITNLHCSEVSRWPGDAAETLYGLKAAMPPQGELILESTPNGAEGCFWTEWMQAETTGTVRHFFPWWWEASYVAAAVGVETLDDEERRLVEVEGLSLEQIGYRRQLRAGFRRLAKQEYAEDAESCFSASGSCMFDVAAIDARLALLRAPLEQRHNRTLLIWFPVMPGRRYAVAVDPAGGGSEGDYSVAQVIELGTGLQCAELQARLPVLELAQAASALAREYNDAWLVVERNNHGSGVLAYLKSVCRAGKVYAQQGQDGWLTSSLSRPGMIAGLGAALVEQPELFQSERLLRECRSFVRLRSGGTGAQNGLHDDCVMAMAMALAVRGELM